MEKMDELREYSKSIIEPDFYAAVWRAKDGMLEKGVKPRVASIVLFDVIDKLHKGLIDPLLDLELTKE